VVFGVACVVTTGAILIEALADEQLRAFVKSGQASGAIMQSGLWAYSRHPNYFGEMTFWWGMWLFGMAADPAGWWTLVGPVCITIMFVYASIPMLDQRSIERRPDYAEHMKRVSGLVPLPRRETG
jgi:steroid 5-alpha reductase family enzyme